MRRAWAAALAVALLGACVPEPPTDVSVKTYNVTGETLSTLERSLAIHGPEVPGLMGRAFAAVETSFVHNFEPQQVGGRCRYSRNGRVALRSEVTLPKWRNRDSAPPELRERWDILRRYAVIHENGHIEISKKYARKLELVYRRISAPDCAALEATLVKEIDPIARAHVEEQTRFDITDPPRFRRFLRQHGYVENG